MGPKIHIRPWQISLADCAHSLDANFRSPKYTFACAKFHGPIVRIRSWQISEAQNTHSPVANIMGRLCAGARLVNKETN